MKMDFSLFLLAVTMLWESSTAIYCYRCAAERGFDQNPVPLCEAFDYSKKYVIECPNSTGCTKKETVLRSLGVTTRSFERGCAQQTMDGEQEKINGHWQRVNNIHEVYDVGCKEDTQEFDKPTRATHCFCRGDYCNLGHVAKSTLGSVLLVIMIFAVL